jgi:ribosomal protein L35AE/L33A
MFSGGGIVRVKFTTTLDEDVIQALKIRAIKEKTDASKIIEKLLCEYLDQKKEPQQ